MPVTDYMGIEGFTVDAKSAQDVYEAIDRMHTQLLDECEATETIIAKRSPAIAQEKLEQLQAAMRILEKAMEALLDLDGVKA